MSDFIVIIVYRYWNIYIFSEWHLMRSVNRKRKKRSGSVGSTTRTLWGNAFSALKTGKKLFTALRYLLAFLNPPSGSGSVINGARRHEKALKQCCRKRRRQSLWTGLKTCNEKVFLSWKRHCIRKSNPSLILPRGQIPFGIMLPVSCVVFVMLFQFNKYVIAI